jgi:hypothetical protein
MILHAYGDGSYALHEDLRSHLGVCIGVGGRHNAPFHNRSAVIKLMMRSSTEAELATLNDLISDVLHYRSLLEELGYPQQATDVYEDNSAAITILNKGDFNYQNKSKHIKIRYEFFKEQIKLGLVKLVYCPTDMMMADIHTKNLTGNKSLLLTRRLLGHPDAEYLKTSGVCQDFTV